jgi:hypothetical protein
MREQLRQVRTIMEEITGQWDGDLPGRREDRAHAALEVIEHLDAIEELLTELDETY